MRKLLFCLLLAVASVSAHAGCTSTEWTSSHKILFHGAGNAIGTFVVTKAFDSPWAGIAAGVAVSLAREQYKINAGYHCEWSSMAWDAAGIALGVYGATHWTVTASPSGTPMMTYVGEF